MDSAEGDELPWLALLVGFAVVGFVAAIATGTVQRLEGRGFQLGRSLLLSMPSWIFWGIAAKPIFGLVRRFPLVRERWVRPLAIHAAIGIALVLLHTVVTVAAARAVYLPAERDTGWATWYLGYLANAGVGNLLIYGGLAAFSQAVESRGRLRRQELDRAVGSSRVDLQACKLEYSIVSPK